MASYIAEILASAAEIELVELDTKLKDIGEQISSLKSEVRSTLENRYINCLPLAYENNLLVDKSRMLLADIEKLRICIEDQTKRNLTNSTEELKNLTEALVENTLIIKIVSQLLELDVTFQKAEEDQKAHCYLEAALMLNLMESQLTEKSEDLKCLDIYKGLRSEVVKVRCQFITQLTEKWRKYITWSETQTNKKKEKLILTIDIKEEDKACIQALHCHENLALELKKFADHFYNNVLCKVIAKQCKVDVDMVESLFVLSNDVTRTSGCIEVLNNLMIVLNFINDRFNVDLYDGDNIISMLGRMISQDFLQFLVKHCLSKSVPRKRENLENYKAVIEEIVKFNDLLLKMDFIKEGDNCIMEYVTNIDVLFANKTCESYLEAARNIMKKDLSNMMQVAPSEEYEDCNKTTNILTELSSSLFQFPACQISKSTQELLDLVDEILNESSKSTGSLAVTLFYTARNVFKMYSHVVPEFHRKLLETIPQQSALFHNNCMFLAHNLQTLNTNFKKRCVSGELNSHLVTFVDLNNILRCQAAKVMQDQMLTQRKHLVDILCDSGLVTLSDNPQFPQGVEKAIRQCLRQLALLQKVWQHVLPINVYCKILGLLCNTLVEEIFMKVIAAKDIPEDTASQLVSVFVIVQQKGPLVFPEPKEINKHVKSWNKFCELVRLLEADLLQVDDRWSDGKGPLALEFKPEQVRQMVRALFQISDKRAVLLARIK